MTDWTIRDATPDDAVAIVALVHRFNVEDGNPPGSLSAADFRTLGFGARPRFRTLLAEAAGQVRGYALFYPSYDTEFGARASICRTFTSCRRCAGAASGGR